MSVYANMARLGLVLPHPTTPAGSFVGATRVGNWIYVSGQVPMEKGAVLMTGHIGRTLSTADGQLCARCCLLNALAQVEALSGSLDNIQGFSRLAGYIASTPEFTQHGQVLEGASSLLKELFPDRWEHARAAVGVCSLPRGVPVEIELTALVRVGR